MKELLQFIQLNPKLGTKQNELQKKMKAKPCFKIATIKYAKETATVMNLIHREDRLNFSIPRFKSNWGGVVKRLNNGNEYRKNAA